MIQCIKLITKAVQKYANVSKPIKTAHWILGWYELFSEFCHLKTWNVKKPDFIEGRYGRFPYNSYQSFKQSSRYWGYQIEILRGKYSEVTEGEAIIV